MLAARPSQVLKVREALAYWDDQDPRYWALKETLEAYDNLCEAERRMESLFGPNALHNLLKKNTDDIISYG